MIHIIYIYFLLNCLLVMFCSLPQENSAKLNVIELLFGVFIFIGTALYLTAKTTAVWLDGLFQIVFWFHYYFLPKKFAARWPEELIWEINHNATTIRHKARMESLARSWNFRSWMYLRALRTLNERVGYSE